MLPKTSRNGDFPYEAVRSQLVDLKHVPSERHLKYMAIEDAEH